jgi:hypothetical protein
MTTHKERYEKARMHLSDVAVVSMMTPYVIVSHAEVLVNEYQKLEKKLAQKDRVIERLKLELEIAENFPECGYLSSRAEEALTEIEEMDV